MDVDAVGDVEGAVEPNRTVDAIEGAVEPSRTVDAVEGAVEPNRTVDAVEGVAVPAGGGVEGVVVTEGVLEDLEELAEAVLAAALA